ncbi:[histone H3]-dimethyl-L-lysine(36) demethylase [Malassezia obtusa]|uniref:JmjC domain-containing histone demethylation protein 1 n=1 Tax=Malassezia obtusa TaxID=76774 RepID=A0AAF0DXC6_9BASI|nr:[histone H3]-dimethyl-L-lysine(36) demethylase [Malassezia obtusa]
MDSPTRAEAKREAPSALPAPPAVKDEETSSAREPEERCPRCAPESESADLDKSLWVACFRCGTWYHTACLGLADVDDYDKWCCDACQKLGYTHKMRAPRRRSARERPSTDYAAIQEGRPPDPLGRWERYMAHCESLPNAARRVSGATWTKEWLASDEQALDTPTLVPAADDGKLSIAGMQVPPSSTTIRDVARLVGPETKVEVIDVRTQMSSSAWTLDDWASYFETPAAEREKVLNVISLEVTGTPMEAMVSAPAMTVESDWVERDWPRDKRPAAEDASKWPKVQRYVLMGVQGAFTDFHIDFAASYVYYHVVWGRKVFLFAPPTPANLAAYRAWTSSARQEAEWLGDALQRLSRTEIRTGETMLIPAGWIHAVYTPEDTLVVGGNFLADYHVQMHWRLEEMEIATRVPRKFRFPHLMRLACR